VPVTSHAASSQRHSGAREGTPRSRFLIRPSLYGTLLVAIGVARSLCAGGTQENESILSREPQSRDTLSDTQSFAVLSAYTAGRQVTFTRHQSAFVSALCDCMRLSCFNCYRIVNPPHEVASRLLFRFLSKHWNSPLFSYNSNLNIRILPRVEFECFSDQTSSHELSNAQSRNVLILFETIEFDSIEYQYVYSHFRAYGATLGYETQCTTGHPQGRTVLHVLSMNRSTARLHRIVVCALPFWFIS